MAEGVLGLGTGQASTLNQELIDKLKSAERKASVEPIETSLSNWELESVKVSEIKLQTQDLLNSIKPFDLFVSGGVNAFETKSATTTGESVTFDAVDAGGLNTGTTTVNVSQLAQRDVYQSSTFTDKDAVVSSTSGSMLVINGVEFSTLNKTYDDLASDININSNFNASVEAVGTDSFRLVIKSEKSGTENALNITETGIDLGLNEFLSDTTVASGTVPTTGLTLSLNGKDFTTNGSDNYSQFIASIDADPDFDASIGVDGTVSIRRSDGSPLEVTNDELGLNLTNNNHTLTAQNLQAKIDGVDYDVSSNLVTVDGGLKITAVKMGESSISIEKDTTSISTLFKDFIDKYNTLVDSIDTELYSADSNIDDRTTLRTILSQVKEQIFGSYGPDSDLNLFNYGLSLDKTGTLSLNDTDFNKAISEDFDNLKNLFIGTAENEGFGTQLKTILDDMDSFDGIITAYEDNLDSRKTSLESDLEKATEGLDSKYAQLAQQFADYGTIISRFNSQFAGLEMMINQSVSN
jgi:flagellar hook-associated protein 2